PGVRPRQRRPVRVPRSVPGLVDLHAAQMLKPPQHVATLVLHADEPQPLHFHNGHQLFTTLLTMLSAASAKRSSALARRSSQARLVCAVTSAACSAALASACCKKPRAWASAWARA